MSRDELEAELLLLHRTIKLSEEVGEAVSNLIGYTGANPRKGVTKTLDEVVDELLDVGVTAVGAVENATGNQGRALPMLIAKLNKVADRVGIPQYEDVDIDEI